MSGEFVDSSQLELDDERFSQLVNEVDIEVRKITRIPRNTRYANTWSVNIWREWATWRNMKMSQEGSEKERKYTKVPFIDEVVPEDEELGYWLSRFVLEIRRKDKKLYPPETLWNICCALQRHIRQFNCSLHMFDETNPFFSDFYKTLDSRMKELTSMGLGSKKQRADPLSAKDENQLWERETINLHTSEGLTFGVFFYACKVFGFRSFDEHRDLCADQFEIKMDEDVYVEKLIYTGRTNKTNQGGIAQRKVEQKEIEQYADPTNERCVVTLFKTYLNLIPRSGKFYKRPIKSNGKPHYSSQNIGVNTLKTMLKTMCEQAGISLEGKNITNHSGKVTCCTTLFNEKFDDKLVRSRSGHTSDALQLYKRPSKELQKKVSDALQPPKKRTPSCTITSKSAMETREPFPAESAAVIGDNVRQMSSAVPVENDKSVKMDSGDMKELFKQYYAIAKDCGSKSITIDFKTETMKISVD